MSKFSKALRSYDTGLLIPAKSPVRLDFSHVTHPTGSFSPIVQRELKVSLYVRYGVDKSARVEVEAMEQNARALIIESVFGEFRIPLLELERALSEHDVQLARNIVADITRQMFNE